MVPVAIAQWLDLTIPVADWGAEHDYDHTLKIGTDFQTAVAAIAGSAVVEAVWVVEMVDGEPVNHPELPNVVAVVDPGISAGHVRLMAQDNSALYASLGVTAVSYKVRLYVQIEHTTLGLIDQSADPAPIGDPMWSYAGTGGAAALYTEEKTDWTGAVNDRTWTLQYAPEVFVSVFMNGLGCRKVASSPEQNEFTWDAGTKTMTFGGDPPESGSISTIVYALAPGTFCYEEKTDWTGLYADRDWVLANTPNSFVVVLLNGLGCRKVLSDAETNEFTWNPSTKTMTFGGEQPEAGSISTIVYTT